MARAGMKTVKTNLQCPYCGMIFPIQRKIGKQKKQGHLKKLYCPICQSTHNHIEWRDDRPTKPFQINFDRQLLGEN